MSAFMPEALLATAFVCVFAATALLWYAAAKLLAELERLRKALRLHQKQCLGFVQFLDGHEEDCPACAALAAEEER